MAGSSREGSLMLVFLMTSWNLVEVLGNTDATSNIFASGCTGQTLYLSCPSQAHIAIKRVFYGVKRNWDCVTDVTGSRSGRGKGSNSSAIDCCRASHTDCQMDGDSMYPTLNTKCSGYQSCQLEIQKVPTREPCRHRAYSDYMTIVYDCVSSGDEASFCSDDVRRGRTLYLRNREYPASIKASPEGGECQCIIRTLYPQGISIHTIDVLLAWADMGPMDCRRSLKIQDPMTYQRDIQCAHRGYYGFKSIYSRPVNNVTVTLSSLPGDGMAFVWLQAKSNDADGSIEILCGQSLQELLMRLRHQSESRQREDGKQKEEQGDKNEEEEAKTDEDEEPEKKSNGTNATVLVGPHTMNSDLAAIVGGIVAAGFLLIAMVIIAMALHCRRVRKEKNQRKPLELFPAVNSEPLDLSSYCKYDYDDDHLCSISRSPMKMVTLADDAHVANSFRPNGFSTITRAEDCLLPRDIDRQSSTLAGIPAPPPSVQNQPLLAGRSYREVHYPGDMSLRFVKPLINNSTVMNPTTVEVETYDHPLDDGHTTFPTSRKTVLISCGPKSPLGKRSKSVTFSQPVAMVTPLNSESEESMEKTPTNVDSEDPSYDNLNKLDIPDYAVMPGKTELIKIPRWDKDLNEEVPSRPLSTFQNSPSPSSESKPFITPGSELDLAFDDLKLTFSDLKLTFDENPYLSNSPSGFWSPNKQAGKPMVMPKPQKAEMFETGV